MKQRRRIYYTDSQKALMWERWRKGESLQQIARGVVGSAAQRASATNADQPKIGPNVRSECRQCGGIQIAWIAGTTHSWSSRPIVTSPLSVPTSWPRTRRCSSTAQRVHRGLLAMRSRSITPQ